MSRLRGNRTHHRPTSKWTPVASLSSGYAASDTFSLGLILALMHHKGAFPSHQDQKLECQYMIPVNGSIKVAAAATTDDQVSIVQYGDKMDNNIFVVWP